MIFLPDTLSAWQTPEFNAVFKNEVRHLDADCLPLQQGLTQSSHANPDSVSAMLLAATEQADCLQIRAGLFYTGIIAGCSCADDPTPVDEINEYCEVRFDIDKLTGAATVTLLRD
ncbi:MAG: hypothetical protein B7Y41_07735 [Hydrogenophilales bacterium 28-61-23]|nr:MAG: hypothetical protein B7Y41_07735 [Hydrogenophilales bacterium 28-61-23]